MPDAEVDPTKPNNPATTVPIGSADQKTEDWLWKWFVAGLVIIAVMAVAGVIVTVAIGRPSDTILTIFTATLAALVGLFVKSPIQPKSG